METAEPKTKPIGQPAFEVCKENVVKPTLIRESKNGVGIWLQWFGESESFDLSGKQFRFPMNTNPDNFSWQPENFEVIMVGPVKEWPSGDPAVVDYMIEQCGGPDVIIIYFISSKFGVDDGNGGLMPAAGVLLLSIQLLDDNCGIITPQVFSDDNVRVEAIKQFQK